MQGTDTGTDKGRARAAVPAIFLAPGQAFEAIARGAGWLLPFLVTVVFMVAGMLLAAPIQNQLMQERTAQAGQQAPAAMGTILLVTQLVSSPVYVLLALAVSTALAFLVYRVAGLGLGYRLLFRFLAYISMVGLGLASLVYSLIMRLRWSGGAAAVDAIPRMGLDIAGGEGLLRGLLSAVNPLSLWWLVLLVMGTSALCGRSRAAVAVPALVAGGLWLVGSGLVAGVNLRSLGG